MELDVRIMVRNDEGRIFMGIGLIWLLESIERHKSINGAAHELHLSYPKALRMIRNLETGLGCPVLVRRKGGSSRGGAELTPLGRDFIRRYGRLQERIRRFSEAAFKKEFTKPLKGRDPH